MNAEPRACRASACQAAKAEAIARILEVMERGRPVLVAGTPGACQMEPLLSKKGVALYGAGPLGEGGSVSAYKDFVATEAEGLLAGGMAVGKLKELSPEGFDFIILAEGMDDKPGLAASLLTLLAPGGTLALCVEEPSGAGALRALGLGLITDSSAQQVYEVRSTAGSMHLEAISAGAAVLVLVSRGTTGSQEALSSESMMAMRAKVRLLESVLRQKDASLDRIFSSNGWKFLVKLYRFRDRFVSPVVRVLSYLKPSNIAEGLGDMVRTGPAWPVIMLKRLLKGKRDTYIDRVDYERFLQAYGLRPEEIQGRRNAKFDYEPLISIAVPVYKPPVEYLREMAESVLAQTYPKWELCLADGGSGEDVIAAMKELAERDSRIKIRLIGQNLGIAGNSNAALALCTGDFVALLDHDDLLTPEALYEVVAAINMDEEADFLYSDEDKVNASGHNRCEPHFKPDFSPDLLRSQNYITHLSVIRQELLRRLGGFREGFDGAQDYDLILRATEAARKVVHIPRVLYHWRMGSQSTAAAGEAKMYAFESGKRALAEHLCRKGMDFDVRDANILGSYRITSNTVPRARLSIVIPSKDHSEDLRRTIDGIRDKTDYKNVEVLVVENNSTEPATFEYYKELMSTGRAKVVKWPSHFNYGAINNFGVKHAEGQVLLLLNNDIDPINPDWITRMLEHAVRKEVGAVGAKLLYPDGTVQHGGVIMGIGGVAGHSHKYLPRSARGYMNRLNVIQNLSAVTGACLMLRREVYDEVGGFDENLPVAFNDIDLCMKIRKRGYLVLWTPYAELYHHESKSRGAESTPEKQARFQSEIEYFKSKWGEELRKGDPYYSPSLTVHLEDFSIRKYDREDANNG